MNYNTPEYWFFLALALGVVATSSYFASPIWYAGILLLLIFAGILHVTRTWPDRGFYLVCAGEPLVVACSMMNFWAGLYAVCMLTGMIGGALGLIESKADYTPLAGFWAGSLLVAIIIQFSNHVLLPLVVVTGLAGIILAVQSIRFYQFKKQYSGA